MNDEKLEQIILGAMIIEPSCISTVLPILKENFFYKPEHKYIFRAIIGLFKSSEPIDIVTVPGALKKAGRLEDCGGYYYVSILTDKVASAESIERHCRMLNQMYIIRELDTFGSYLSTQAKIPSTDCFELIEKVQKKVSDLTEFASNNVVKVGQVFDKLIDEIREVQQNGKPTGVLSGLSNLDKVTGGFQKGAIYVIAARPGMGKTAFALAIAKTPVIEFGRKVAFFSIEMSSMELVGRLVSSESEIDSRAINQKTIDHAQLTAIGGRCSKLVDANLYIDDTANLKVSDLQSKARRLVYEFGVEMIVVDYLQFMDGREDGEKVGNREREIARISRSLKTLAKELNIPVIALAQLGREVEKREDKRPQLSDLRESGAIEQDADVVAFLWRPKYYDLFPNGYEYADKTLQTDNLLIFDIAKGRGIPTIEIPLKFYGQFMKVENYDMEPGPPVDNNPKPLLENKDFLNF